MIHSHFIFATVLFSSSILINDLQEKMLADTTFYSAGFS